MQNPLHKPGKTCLRGKTAMCASFSSRLSVLSPLLFPQSIFQVYEGIVICMKNAGARRTFTVRKESYGIGVERVFPVNSPRIVKVEIVRVGKVRRAKLYYLRDKVGKGKKVKEKLGGAVSAFIAEQNRNAEKAAHAQEEALKAEHNAEHSAAAAEAKK